MYATHKWITAGLLPSILFHGPDQQASDQQIPFLFLKLLDGMSGRQGNDGWVGWECVHLCVLYTSVCTVEVEEVCSLISESRLVLHDTMRLLIFCRWRIENSAVVEQIPWNVSYFSVSLALLLLFSALHKPFFPCFLSFSFQYLQKKRGLSGPCPGFVYLWLKRWKMDRIEK